LGCPAALDTLGVQLLPHPAPKESTMQIRSVVIVAALGLASFAHGQSPAVQWRVEDGGNGHWYQVIDPGPACWENAKSDCESRAGYLATLATEAESQFVRSRLPNNGLCYWIGGFQDLEATDYVEPAGGWRWVTGEPWTPLWDITFGQPENGQGMQHVACIYRYGLHDAGDCNSGDGRMVVEWSSDCNGDGIVDYGQILDGTFEDVNSNGVPDTCEIDPCPGDINESGVVNGIDLAAILAYWGTDGGKFPRTDANRDGTVDAQDLAIVLGGWGNCP
jgi:hypothetical protein